MTIGFSTLEVKSTQLLSEPSPTLEVSLRQFKQFAKLYLLLTLGDLLGGLWTDTLLFIFSGCVLRHVLNRHLIKCPLGSPFNLAPHQLYGTFNKDRTYWVCSSYIWKAFLILQGGDVKKKYPPKSSLRFKLVFTESLVVESEKGWVY